MTTMHEGGLLASPSTQLDDVDIVAVRKAGIWDRIYSWRGVALLCTCFVALLALQSTAQGLGYERFSIRADDCYHPRSYMKFGEDVTKDLDTCKVFSYPYRLREPTWASRTAAWTMYLTHQFGQWIILAQVQSAHSRGEVGWPSEEKNEVGGCPVGGVVNKYAVRMFCLNMGVTLLKMVLGQFFYDGLSNDVPEWSAQYSVMLWIFFSVILKMPKRGLFFGYLRSLPWTADVVDDLVTFVRKNHGYLFSFGTTYNYWFHPVEGSPGFILGYLYQFCMILQSGFLFHPMHKNIWWTTCLELGVVPHAILIAFFFANTSDPIASVVMFGFGFSVLGLITHMHGLELSRRARAGIATVVLCLVPIFYLAVGRSLLDSPSEVLRIPVLCCFVPLIIWLVWALGSLLLWPLRPVHRRFPWTLAGFWFVVWAAQIGFFVYVGAFNPEKST